MPAAEAHRGHVTAFVPLSLAVLRTSAGQLTSPEALLCAGLWAKHCTWWSPKPQGRCHVVSALQASKLKQRETAPPLRQALLWSERQRVATSPSSKTTSHFIRRALHKETRSACPVGGGPHLSTRQDPRLQGPHARRSSVSFSAWQGPD